MKENIDNLLNEYIDGNLDSRAIEELESVISGDEGVLNKLKGLKAVDSHLREMETIPAPENTTEKIWEKISGSISGNLPKSYFLHGMVGLFSVSLIGMIVFFFTYFSGSGREYIEAENTVNAVNTFVNNFFEKFSSYVASVDIMLLVSVVILVIMLSLYYLFESHKEFRKKLNSITQ